MQNLTASLLKLARLDAGVIELNRANHSLNAIILELAESFRERLDRESKTFALEAKTEVLYHLRPGMDAGGVKQFIKKRH